MAAKQLALPPNQKGYITFFAFVILLWASSAFASTFFTTFVPSEAIVAMGQG